MYSLRQSCFGRDYSFLSHYDGEIHLRDQSQDFWSDSLLMCDTYTELYKYIDYQMMMGLSYLARIYRLSLDPTKPELPPQTYWAKSSNPPMSNKLRMGPMTRLKHSRQDPCEGFRLTPIEAWSKGYELSLMFAGWGAEHGFVIKPSKPVFADGSFKPIHMGGPTPCFRCKRMRKELEERDAAQIREAEMLHD